MNEPRLHPSAEAASHLPLGVLRRLDAVCLRYEQSLREGAGEAVRIEDFVIELPPDQRSYLVCELVAVDREVRDELEWAVPTVQAYLDRFPEVAADLRRVLAFPEESEAPHRRDLHAFDEGARLGVYEILERTGVGGMGEVYRARDPRLDRLVAVKTLRAHTTHLADRVRRFEREAKAVAALSHPNILSIFDYGSVQGTPYAVMEWLAGQTLGDRLKSGRLSLGELTQLAIAVAGGLAEAHGKGVVHRDLKPDNLFLTEDGKIKILDFGLAAVAEAEPGPAATQGRSHETQVGVIVGTLGYVSPEQVRGESAEAPSDVFSLGCVLFEAATGERAFNERSPSPALREVLEYDPTPRLAQARQIPADFRRLIQSCLHKQSEQRPTAAELHRAVVQSQRKRDRQTRRGWLALAAVGLAVALSLSIVALLPRGNRSAAVAAYEAGKQQWTLRTRAGLESAMAHYREAIALDGQFAEAHAALAQGYIVLGEYGLMESQAAYPLAESAANRAREINPQLADAYVVRGMVCFEFHWDYARAEEDFLEALKLNADGLTAQQWYAEFLSALGRHDEALARIRAVQKQYPDSAVIQSIHGRLLYKARRFAAAKQQLETTLERFPDFARAHGFLAEVLEQQKQYPEAIKHHAALSPSAARQLEQALAKGERDYWRARRDLAPVNSEFPVADTFLAVFYARMGDTETALSLLEQAQERRDGALAANLRVNPAFESLWSHERYSRLLKQMGMKPMGMQRPSEVDEANEAEVLPESRCGNRQDFRS